VPGLTAAGLQIATLGDVRAQINADWQAAFGASMDVSDRSPDGQLIGIVAEVFALFWELLEAINNTLDIDKAQGAFLRALVRLRGTVELPPSFSTVTLTLTGTPTAIVPAGSLASTLSTGQQFATTDDDDGTIVALAAWAASTGYAAGDRVTNAGNAYVCITTGVSAGSGGPVTTAPDITDNTAHWRFMGVGTGAVDVIGRATVTGPIVAVSGDIANMDSQIGGWEGVINLLDATLGRNTMTDAALRALSEFEIAQPGTSPKDAIRAALLQVGAGGSNPVMACTVFSNVTDITDADGVPPHSVEALVHGGDDQAIFDALLANVADGIRTHGSVVGTSTDSAGNVHTMKFSRPTEILIYVAVTLLKDPALYPSDGDTQVKTAVATTGNAKPDGTDVVASAILASVFSVAGMLDVSLPFIGIAPSPVLSTTIVVTNRQRAVFDTTRISVSSSNGSP
jgi:uncharacterized phage protein gp47/JayE